MSLAKPKPECPNRLRVRCPLVQSALFHRPIRSGFHLNNYSGMNSK